MMFILFSAAIAASGVLSALVAREMADRKSINRLAKTVYVWRMKGEPWLSYRNRVVSRSLVGLLRTDSRGPRG